MIVYPASTELPAIDQPKSYLVRRRLAGVEASRSGRGFPDCGCGGWLPRRGAVAARTATGCRRVSRL